MTVKRKVGIKDVHQKGGERREERRGRRERRWWSKTIKHNPRGAQKASRNQHDGDMAVLTGERKRTEGDLEEDAARRLMGKYAHTHTMAPCLTRRCTNASGCVSLLALRMRARLLASSPPPSLPPRRSQPLRVHPSPFPLSFSARVRAPVPLKLTRAVLLESREHACEAEMRQCVGKYPPPIEAGRAIDLEEST